MMYYFCRKCLRDNVLIKYKYLFPCSYQCTSREPSANHDAPSTLVTRTSRTSEDTVHAFATSLIAFNSRVGTRKILKHLSIFKCYCVLLNFMWNRCILCIHGIVVMRCNFCCWTYFLNFIFCWTWFFRECLNYRINFYLLHWNIQHADGSLPVIMHCSYVLFSKDFPGIFRLLSYVWCSD